MSPIDFGDLRRKRDARLDAEKSARTAAVEAAAAEARDMARAPQVIEEWAHSTLSPLLAEFQQQAASLGIGTVELADRRKAKTKTTRWRDSHHGWSKASYPVPRALFEATPLLRIQWDVFVRASHPDLPDMWNSESCGFNLASDGSLWRSTGGIGGREARDGHSYVVSLPGTWAHPTDLYGLVGWIWLRGPGEPNPVEVANDLPEVLSQVEAAIESVVVDGKIVCLQGVSKNSRHTWNRRPLAPQPALLEHVSGHTPNPRFHQTRMVDAQWERKRAGEAQTRQAEHGGDAPMKTQAYNVVLSVTTWFMPVAAGSWLIGSWNSPERVVLIAFFTFALAYRAYVRIGTMSLPDPERIRLERMGSVTEYELADIAWIAPSAAAPGGIAMFIALRPAFRRPIMLTTGPEEALRRWAKAGVRVLGHPKWVLEVEDRADAFFADED